MSQERPDRDHSAVMNRLEAMKPAALRATIKEIAELHAPTQAALRGTG